MFIKIPCCYGYLDVAKVENILLKEDGDYVLCDYGSCSLDTLNPEVSICYMCVCLLFVGVAVTADNGSGSV